MNGSSPTTTIPAAAAGKRRRRPPVTILGMLVLSSVIGFQLGTLFSSTSGSATPTTRIEEYDDASSSPLILSKDSTSTSSVASSSVASSSNFQLAQHESFGFFKDISETDWKDMKRIVEKVYPNTLNRQLPSTLGRTLKGVKANHFFQDYFEPDFSCRQERRIGRRGDGGKWVCDPHRILSTSSSSSPSNKNHDDSCLVYSIGSNGDTSFESAVKKDISEHCEIHTFDMKNYTETVESVGAIFHQWGISNTTKKDRRGRLYKTLAQTVQELGHQGRRIDIFKIDCEGCEWSTFPSFFKADVDLRQILIELHALPGKHNASKFQPMPLPESFDFFDALYHQGYVIFHKEVNVKFWHFGQCIEYAFLKLHPNFFSGIPSLQEQPKSSGTTT